MQFTENVQSMTAFTDTTRHESRSLELLCLKNRSRHWV